MLDLNLQGGAEGQNKGGWAVGREELVHEGKNITVP